MTSTTWSLLSAQVHPTEKEKDNENGKEERKRERERDRQRERERERERERKRDHKKTTADRCMECYHKLDSGAVEAAMDGQHLAR